MQTCKASQLASGEVRVAGVRLEWGKTVYTEFRWNDTKTRVVLYHYTTRYGGKPVAKTSYAHPDTVLFIVAERSEDLEAAIAQVEADHIGRLQERYKGRNATAVKNYGSHGLRPKALAMLAVHLARYILHTKRHEMGEFSGSDDYRKLFSLCQLVLGEGSGDVDPDMLVSYAQQCIKSELQHHPR